jgi:hypothetical protein
MKVKLVWIIVALIAVIGFVLYRSQSAMPRLNVEPHAAQEIDKAKRR